MQKEDRGRDNGGFYNTFVQATGALTLAPYTIPTFVRKIVEDRSDGEYPTDADCYGLAAGAAATGGLMALEIKFYIEHPEALLALLGTNIVSGTWELGKLISKRIKRKRLEATV